MCRQVSFRYKLYARPTNIFYDIDVTAWPIDSKLKHRSKLVINYSHTWSSNDVVNCSTATNKRERERERSVPKRNLGVSNTASRQTADSAAATAAIIYSLRTHACLLRQCFQHRLSGKLTCVNTIGPSAFTVCVRMNNITVSFVMASVDNMLQHACYRFDSRLFRTYSS